MTSSFLCVLVANSLDVIIRCVLVASSHDVIIICVLVASSHDIIIICVFVAYDDDRVMRHWISSRISTLCSDLYHVTKSALGAPARTGAFNPYPPRQGMSLNVAVNHTPVSVISSCAHWQG